MKTELAELKSRLFILLKTEANRLAEFSDFHIELESRLGSANAEHRMNIRAALVAHLRSREAIFDEANILDLSRPPKIANYAISISHTENAGGFVCARTDSARRLGFDIETRERVQPAIVKRVLMGDEAYSEARLAQHWCAKEAAVKALGNASGQLPSITEVKILWDDDSRFSTNGAWGIVQVLGNFSCSIAISGNQ